MNPKIPNWQVGILPWVFLCQRGSEGLISGGKVALSALRRLQNAVTPAPPKAVPLSIPGNSKEAAEKKKKM